MTVAFVQDAVAHRPYRTDGERVTLACRVDGSQPVDLFLVVDLQTVSPLRRCRDCFLGSNLLEECPIHDTWVHPQEVCHACEEKAGVVETTVGVFDPDLFKGLSLDVQLSQSTADMLRYLARGKYHLIPPGQSFTFTSDVGDVT